MNKENLLTWFCSKDCLSFISSLENGMSTESSWNVGLLNRFSKLTLISPMLLLYMLSAVNLFRP